MRKNDKKMSDLVGFVCGLVVIALVLIGLWVADYYGWLEEALK